MNHATAKTASDDAVHDDFVASGPVKSDKLVPRRGFRKPKGTEEEMPSWRKQHDGPGSATSFMLGAKR